MPLISLFVAKIVIPIVAALAIATIYVAIKTKKIENNKYQNLGESNSQDEILDDNYSDEINKKSKDSNISPEQEKQPEEKQQQ